MVLQGQNGWPAAGAQHWCSGSFSYFKGVSLSYGQGGVPTSVRIGLVRDAESAKLLKISTPLDCIAVGDGLVL